MSEISVVVVGSTSISSAVGNGDTVNVNVGDQTIGGGNGAAATIEAGAVTTIDATQTATVTNVGTAYAAKFNFSLPRGATGLTGPANSLSISKVSTGTTAAVSISGSAPSQTLSFVLQPGPAGPANALSIGSVSTGATAAVSISGSAPSQTLSFVLPQGPQGPATTLKIGTVVTGVDAAATLTGTGLTQSLNFVLPQGATGIQGPQGVQGNVGPANSLTVGSVTTTTATTAAVSITGNAPSQQISFVIPQGPQGIQGAGGPYTTIQAGTVTTGAAGSAAKIDTVTSGSTVTLNFTIPRGVDGTANLADETPQPLGVARAGSALTAARADHVHAVPVIAYGNLTGVPSTFTPATHQHAISDVTNLQAALDAKQVAGSYVTLDGSGKIPSSVLPSYVDDIVEAANYAALTALTGEGGKLYVTIDTRKLYRWGGSAYVEIASSPGSTDAVTEGSTNLYFTTKRAADAAPVQSVNGKTGAVTIEAGGIAWSSVPTATTTTTKAGALSYDSSYVYVANDVNQWRRTAIEDWTTPTISISVQPSDQTAVSGTATFSVTATATQNAELLYQWQRQTGGAGSWVNIATGLSATLSLDSLSYAANNGDKYRVVITSGASGTGGTAVNNWLPAVVVELTPTATLTSGEATLTISASISIVSQPQSVSLTSGTSATFAVSATTPGTGLTYQWQSSPDGTNWTTINGATSSSYALSGVTETGNNGYRYRCIVSSSGYSDATSNAAALAVAPITVTSQPSSQTGSPVAGTTPAYTASFTSVATSPAGAPTLQWEISTDGGANYSDLSGQTGSSLALTGLTSSDSGKRYRAKFTKSGWNTVRSNAATLTVPTDVITVSQQPSSTTATVSSYSDSPVAVPLTVTTGTWQSISIANGTYFATPNDTQGGDYIGTSPDGVTWTKRLAVLPVPAKWSPVRYFGGVYMTLNLTASGANYATSSDGLTWTARSTSGTWSLPDEETGFIDTPAGLLVLSSPNARYTTDGINWTTVDTSVSVGGTALANAQLFLSDDRASLYAMHSDTATYATAVNDSTRVATFRSYLYYRKAALTSSGVGSFSTPARVTNNSYKAISGSDRIVTSQSLPVNNANFASVFNTLAIPQGSTGVVGFYVFHEPSNSILQYSGLYQNYGGGGNFTYTLQGYVYPVSAVSSVSVAASGSSTLVAATRGGFSSVSLVDGSGNVTEATYSTGFAGSVGRIGSRWIATTASGVASSNDGSNWALRQVVTGTNAKRLVTLPTVAWYFDGSNGYYSSDGVSWTQSAAKTGFQYLSTQPLYVPGGVNVFYRTGATISGGSSTPVAYMTSLGGVPSASFSSAATTTFGSPAIQWQQSSDGGATWSNISSATSSPLSLTPSSADSGKRYRAVFTKDSYSTVNSNSATLTVP
jgi:hypothetical protein